MLFGMRFARLLSMSPRMTGVAAGSMRMMGRFLVASGLVMLSRLAMVVSGVCVMFGRFFVMLGSFLGHEFSSSLRELRWPRRSRARSGHDAKRVS